jgi:hypothetical protein
MSGWSTSHDIPGHRRSEDRPTTRERRSSKSSAAPSANSDIELSSTTSSFKQLGVYHANWHSDLIVHDVDDTPIYYVDTSFWTPGKPDVTIRQGGGNIGTPVGVVNYIAFSSDMKVGVGDPTVNHGMEMVWEDLAKTSKIKHNTYQWSMVVDEGLAGESSGERRTFVWRRTHHYGLENEAKSAKWATVNFKLEDVRTGDIVANFATTGMKQWNKMGKFVIQQRYGPEWEFMVLLTGLGIIQKARRRERIRSRGASDGAWG